jgi:predicted Fe-S protein YdhL (DUF1289 family)
MNHSELHALVTSPCVDVCELNADNICKGCGRTTDEIEIWSRADNGLRRAIKQAAELRKQAIVVGNPH